ncbi:DUF523 domain-containing protein [Alkalibaculum sp. M08DMB]|uniref:DUF523 domain-containing protein n=1 Tax=Alkalibaculum sporogenes TaxID=2655001 RepID=A0A6A7KDF9_9FIRM|nr:DUF523 domain-containing protein [Alkalibaculum sporogenes]MPW27197.1 DUF523 domain-containing protein [Alkalibaculum sporogenes]
MKSNKIIVSACLAGCNCRYNGKNSKVKEIEELVNKGKAITVCPEVLGGLQIPRKPCEIQENIKSFCIVNEKGEDLTKAFLKGAQKTLELAQKTDPPEIILKSKSPSCGYGQVYDGTFTGTLRKGNGVTAEILYQNGFNIISVD